MKISKLISILAVSIVMVGTACEKQPDGGGPSIKPVTTWDPTAGDVDVINGTKIEAGNNLCGWIYDDATKKGVAGVPVTDGYKFTVTDANGVYQMKADSRCRKVYYTVPADCEFPVDEKGKPDFFSRKVLRNLSKVQRYDFHLTPAAAKNNFTAVMIGDPQCSTAAEATRYKNETVKDIKNVLDKGAKTGRYSDPFCVTLGDVIFDSNDTYSDMVYSMQNVKLESGKFLPFMQCMGNHDHNALSFEAAAEIETMQYNAQELFLNNLGPADYSFNRGKVHVVVMDDVRVKGKSTTSKSNGYTCSYDAGISDQQWEWLKADLANVQNKGDMMIFFCAHIPFRAGSSSGGSNVNTKYHYADVLKALTEFHEAHIMIGHTHYSQNYIHSSYKTKSGKPVYEHIHGAACGAWWAAHSDVIGGPSGYSIYQVEGNEVTEWVYKGTNRDENFQLRVYNGNQTYTGSKSYNYNWYNTEKQTLTDAITFTGNTATKNAFVAQVWDDDDTFWTLEFWQNGKKVGDFTRLANGSQTNKAVIGYWFNEKAKKTDTWASKTASHYWCFVHPNANKVQNWDPMLETDWEVKATHTYPNGKVATYSCNQLTVDYDTFANATSF